VDGRDGGAARKIGRGLAEWWVALASRAEGRFPAHPRAEREAKPGAGGASLPRAGRSFRGAGAEGAGGGMRRGRRRIFQDMAGGGMPPLKLDRAEKPGRMPIMLSATNGADPASVTGRSMF